MFATMAIRGKRAGSIRGDFMTYQQRDHRGLAHAAAASTTAAILALAIVPPARAQGDPLAAAAEALDQAALARAQAQKALDAADVAVRTAQKALEAARAAGPLPAGDAAPAKLPTGGRPASCEAYDGDPAAIIDDTNAFQACIGLRKWTDYSPADLNLKIVASSDTSISIAPSWTLYRKTRTTDAGDLYNSYHKLSGGIAAKLNSDKKAANFADLTSFEFVKGVEYTLGYEYGRTAASSRATYLKTASDALKAARRACIADLASDPAVMAEPSPIDISYRCSGAALTAWIASDATRRTTYYRSMILPQWGQGKEPAFYIGAEAKYSKPEFAFFPLNDPAGTGPTPVTTLPPGFPNAGSSSASRSLFSLKAYVGTVAGDRIGLSASVSYGRTATFLKAYDDQDVCAPQPATGMLHLKCAKIDTAPPYYSEGWSVGGRAAVKVPRLLFLPELGLEAKLSYRFDIDQLGFEAPLRFAIDSDGKTTGGIRVGCTSDGSTSNGTKIAGDCQAAFFVGSAFKLAGKP